jgi:hypothetical protein
LPCRVIIHCPSLQLHLKQVLYRGGRLLFRPVHPLLQPSLSVRGLAPRSLGLALSGLNLLFCTVQLALQSAHVLHICHARLLRLSVAHHPGLSLSLDEPPLKCSSHLRDGKLSMKTNRSCDEKKL